MRFFYLFIVGMILVNVGFAQSNQAKSICSGGTVTLTPLEVGLSGAQFKWTSNATTGTVTGNTDELNGVASLSQTLSVTGNTVGTVVYSITPTIGNPFTFTVTVNPTAITVDVSALTINICSGANFYANVSNQVPAGTTYTWTVSNIVGTVGGAGAVNQTIQQPYIVQPLTYTGAANTTGSITYTVTPYVGTCANPTFTFPITIRLASGTAPTITNTTTQICSGSARNFTPTITPASTNTSWARPAVAGTTQPANSGTTSIAETLTSTSLLPVNAYYFYSLNYSGGLCPTTQVVTSIINPVANIANKTVTVCSNSSFTVNINDLVPTNTTYNWATPVATPTSSVSGLAAQGGLTSSIGPIVLTTNPTNKTTSSTVVYSVRPFTITNGQSCAALTTFPVTVTLNPVPTITNQTAPASCSGVPFNFPIANVPSGTTYTWSALPTISTSGALTGGATQLVGSSVISQTLINTTTSAATATYIVTPLSGTCQGSSFNATVSINPIATITNLNQVKTTCSGSPITNIIGGVPTGTLYSWTVQSITPANSVSNSTSDIGQVLFSQSNLVNTTNAPAVVSYIVQPVSGTCLGTPYNLDITVNPTPNFSPQAAISCSGSVFKIEPANAPAGTTYTWSLPSFGAGIGGGTDQTVGQPNISQTLVNTSAANSTATYSITASANGCRGTAFDGVITVKPLPVIANYANSSCSGSTFTSTPNSSLAGTTYTWPLPVSTVIGAVTGGINQTIPQSVIGDVLTNTTNISATYIYTVTPVANFCTGNSFTLTQTVKPTPIVSPVRTEICSNTAFSVSPSNVPFGTTYTWGNPDIAPAGSITGGSANGAALSVIGQTLTNPTSSNAVALYTVTPITNGCTGSTFSIEVTVKIAANLSTQTAIICSGQTFDVKPSGVPTGTTYTWTDPLRGPNVSGGSANITGLANISQLLEFNSITAGTGTATYSVTPSSNGCFGNNFNLVVTIKPLPLVPDINGNVCSGNSFTTTPNSNLANTLYTWITPTILPAGSLSGALERTSAVQNISQTITNTTNAPATASYKVTPFSNGCTGNVFTFVQTVNPTPNISTQTTKICSNTSFNVAPTNVPVGSATLYTWSAPVINPSSSLTGSSLVTTPVTIISQSLTNITNAVATATYDVTPISGTCTGSTFKVLVTVTPRAAIVNQTTTVCSGSAFNVLPTTAPSNTLYTWADPVISNGILGATIQNTPQAFIGQTLTNSNLNILTGTANYVVTPITDGCTSNTFTVAVNINSSNSVLNSVLTPSAVCSGNTFSYLPTSANTGTAFAWTRAAVTGISNAELNSFGNINEILNNTTDASITVAYTFTLSTNGCTNLNKQIVNVLVKPSPKLSSSITPPAICSAATFSYAATSNTFNTVFSWVRTYVVGLNEPITSGVGNINESLSNPTYSAVIVPYNFTLNANGCSNLQTVFVTVNPVLTVPDQNAYTCSNTYFNFKAPNTPDNTVYTWSSPIQAPGISGGSPQTLVPQNTLTQLLINNANAVGTATYIVTPIIPATFTAGCIGRPFNLIVSVSPQPILTSILNPPAVCSGTEFNYVPTSNIPSAAFNWTRETFIGISNVKASGFNTIKETLLDTTTGPINIKYRYTLSAFGCTDTTSIVNLLVNASPILKTQVYTICSGSAFVVPNELMPARTTYTWGNPVVVPTAGITGFRNITNPLSVVSDTLTNTTVSPSTANYIIQPIGSICNIAPFNVIVSVKPAPSILPQETSACSGAAFSYTPTNIPTGTTFNWQLPTIAPFGVVTGFTADTSNQSAINQKLINLSIDYASATYAVIPTSNGCVGNSFKLKVNVNPIPTTRISGPSGICINGVDSILVNFSGTSPWSLSWNDSKNGLPTTITDIKTSPYTIYQPSLPNANTYTFKLLRVKDAYCSNDTSTVSLTQDLYVLPADTVVATNGTQLCVGKTLPLTVNAVRAGYQWFRNDTLIVGARSAVYDVLLPGLYSSATLNSFGCYGKSPNSIRMVQVFNNPVINFSYDSTCMNVITNYKNLSDTTSAGAITWKWIFGGKDSTQGFNTNYAFNTSGTQNVKLYASSAYCGYSIFKDSNILIRRPEANKILPPVFTYKNTATQLMARTFTGANYSHKWIPSYGLDNAYIINPIFNFNVNQTYAIKIISEYGCTTTDSMRVHVFEQGLIEIFVPKSFSPNRDGVNDQLFVYLAGIKDFRYFKIYNKYGQLVFDTKNAETPWEGKVNGTDQPLGAYVWIAEGIDINGKTVTQKGSVMLLR